jgi:hypothetical protein
MDGLTVDGAYTDVKFKTTQGRLDLWLTDTDTTEGQVRVRGDANNLVFITNTAERMRIDSSGAVGIGTSSPDEALEVSGDVKSSGGNFGIYHFGETSDVTKIVGRDGGHGSFPNTMDFFTNSAQRMTIDSSGNVGIGITNPSDYYAENLVVGAADEGGITIKSGATEKAYLMFADGTSGSAAYRSYLGYDHALDSLNVVSSSYTNFYTGDPAQERMRIDSSGNVGIGTSSPSVPVHASGKIRAQKSGQASAYVQLSANEVTSNYAADIFLNDTGLTFKHNSNSRGFVFDQNGTERLRIDSSGNLLVGRTSTAGSLTDHGHQLYNSGLYYLYSSATGNSDAFRMYDGNGTLRATIDGDGDYTDLSDVRAKENIVNAPSVLSTINDLQVRSFTWKVDGKHQTYGFVAQELNEAIPEAVSLPEEEDGMWGVKHAKLVPVLVKAIQEQQTLIESLTARIAALEE